MNKTLLNLFNMKLVTLLLVCTLLVSVTTFGSNQSGKEYENNVRTLLIVTHLVESMLQTDIEIFSRADSITTNEYEAAYYNCVRETFVEKVYFDIMIPVFKKHFNNEISLSIIDFSKSKEGENKIRELIEEKITADEFNLIVAKYNKKHAASVINAAGILEAWKESQKQAQQVAFDQGYDCLNRPDILKLKK